MAITTIYYAADNQGVIIDPALGAPTSWQLYLQSGPGSPSTVGAIGYRMPLCTVRNLRVLVLAYSGFPSGIDFEIYKNNLPTGLKIPAVAAVGPFQDLVNVAAFAAGDALDMTLKPVSNSELGTCRFSATVERF